MVSSLIVMSELKSDRLDPEAAPHVMLGAASPLWLLFGGAAAAGATWWWWSARWREAVNLEALSGAPAAALETLAEPESPLMDAETVVAETLLESVPVEAVAEGVDLEAEAPAPADEIAAEVAVPEVVLEAVSEPVAEVAPLEGLASETVADDLTRLVGVGPKLSSALAELGITRFSQIAAWTAEDIASFDQLLALKGRAERDAWVAQARRLMGEASV